MVPGPAPPSTFSKRPAPPSAFPTPRAALALSVAARAVKTHARPSRAHFLPATMCDCGAMDCVVDAAAGDEVCRQCGVVVQAHMFDERVEYYSEKSGARVGPPEPWLLPAPPVVLECVRRRRHGMANPDPHAATRRLFAAVDAVSTGFSTDVRDTAKALCRDLHERRTIRCTQFDVYAATAVYLATRMHGKGIGRSKKEIVAACGGGDVTEHAISAAAKAFRTHLGDKSYAFKLRRGLDAADLVHRAIDRLGLDAAHARAAKKAAHELAGVVPPREVEGKTPRSVCAGVVACVLRSMDVQLPRKSVAEGCCVSAATLEKMAARVRAWADAASAGAEQASA